MEEWIAGVMDEWWDEGIKGWMGREWKDEGK